MAHKIFTRDDFFKILDETISPPVNRVPRLTTLAQKMKLPRLRLPGK